MKREDFSPDELDGMLVAFSDGELDEPKSLMVAKLISENTDLAIKVENYISTGASLRDIFNTDNVETPKHIADKILHIAARVDQSHPMVASIEASTEHNVVEFNILKKLSSKLSVTAQSLTQMAAALVLGVFLGPSLFSGLGDPRVYQEEPPLNAGVQLRGVGDTSSDKSKHLMLLAVKQGSPVGSDGKATYIYSGETIATDIPFTVLVTAPLSGLLEVFDITDGTKESTIWSAKVKEGMEVVVPGERAFELSNQSTFALRAVFSNEVSTVKIETSFLVAPY